MQAHPINCFNIHAERLWAGRKQRGPVVELRDILCSELQLPSCYKGFFKYFWWEWRELWPTWGEGGDAEGRVSGKWKWRLSFWAVPSSPPQWLPFPPLYLWLGDELSSCLLCHSFLTSASSTSESPLFWSYLDFMHRCSRGRKVGSSDGVLADIVTLASFLLPSFFSLPPHSAEE